MELPRPGVAVRWTVAACISGAGVCGLTHVLATEGNMMAVFAKSLFGLAALMAGIILASPEMVVWAVSPVHRLLDAIFLPSESEPPPVDYTLARFYGQRMRYVEACEEYLKLIHYHPEEKLAYLEGIQAAGRAGNEEAARKLHRGGKRLMRARGDRVLLENVYALRHELPFHAVEGEEPGGLHKVSEVA